MRQIVLAIDGMMCGMCESHVNDALRRAFEPKKVVSNHKKGQAVILTDTDIPNDRLEAVIAATGYSLISVTRTTSEEIERPRGLKALFRK